MNALRPLARPPLARPSLAHPSLARPANGAPNGAASAQAAAAAPFAPYPPVKPEGYGGIRRARATANGTANGAPNGAPDGARIDAEYVIYRLEESGRTLLALPQGGHSTRLRTSTIEMVRSAAESYGWGSETARLRPAVPDAARITRMDEAMAWIPLIPPDRFVLRRIVGARSLVSPVTERHLFPWRRLGGLLGADHKAVQRWHAQGIDLIVAALNRRP